VWHKITRSSATAEIARDADVHFCVDDVHGALTLARPSQRDDTDEPWQGHSRSLKVICSCANQRRIYDFLLALVGNLTSIFNRSWEITPSLHIHTPPLFQAEVEKDGWEEGMLWSQGAQNIGLFNNTLKSATYTVRGIWPDRDHFDPQKTTTDQTTDFGTFSTAA